MVDAAGCGSVGEAVGGTVGVKVGQGVGVGSGAEGRVMSSRLKTMLATRTRLSTHRMVWLVLRFWRFFLLTGENSSYEASDWPAMGLEGWPPVEPRAKD